MSLARSSRRNPPSRRRSARAALGAALTLLSSLVVPMAAGAARPVPSVHVAGLTDATPSGLLESVSCTGPSFCMAVGTGPDQGSVLAESWDGATWTVSLAAAVGPYPSSLTSVSCTSPDRCTAVGATGTSPSTSAPLVETWDGSAWTGTTVGGAPPLTQFDGVSCTADSFCLAVGSGSGQVFAARWDGTTWTEAPLTVPDDTSDLQSVSCSTSTDCVATGSQSVCPPGLGCLSSAPVVAVWDGAWTLPAVPNGNGTFVRPVDCPAPTATCVAVGASNDPSGLSTDSVAETRDGTTWTVVPGPTIGPASSTLSGLSCVSPTSCLAVGDSFNVSTTIESAPVAELWDGSSLTVTTPQDPSATFAQLLGVDCTSATSCVAVGSERDPVGSHTLVETWDGSSWAVVPSPDAPIVTVPQPTFAVLTSSLPQAAAGVRYPPVQLEVTGTSASTSPYVTTVRWTKGPATAPATALPEGMRLSATGVLSGTPNRHLTPGSYTVYVQVTEKVTTVVDGRRVRASTVVTAGIPVAVS